MATGNRGVKSYIEPIKKIRIRTRSKLWRSSISVVKRTVVRGSKKKRYINIELSVGNRRMAIPSFLVDDIAQQLIFASDVADKELDRIKKGKGNNMYDDYDEYEDEYEDNENDTEEYEDSLDEYEDDYEEEDDEDDDSNGYDEYGEDYD